MFSPMLGIESVLNKWWSVLILCNGISCCCMLEPSEFPSVLPPDFCPAILRWKSPFLGVSVGQCFGQRGKVVEQLLFLPWNWWSLVIPPKPGMAQWSFSNFPRHFPLSLGPLHRVPSPWELWDYESHNNILKTLPLAFTSGQISYLKLEKKVESGEHNLGCRGNKSLISECSLHNFTKNKYPTHSHHKSTHRVFRKKQLHVVDAQYIFVDWMNES